MKDKISEILRESTSKNSLGVSVSKPNQELIVLRGIPGSGKSTKAKSLVGQGKIHSTDDLIDGTGDYRGFFANMISTGDFNPLSQMHSKNLKNAIESMKSGISPVVVDNTNIKQNESKSYVVAALELGYADDNIKFIDIGTAGLDAETLAKRNTHSVPLEKIKSMIDSHTSQGTLTLKSVLASKDMYKTPDVSYSGVVLDPASRTKLLSHLHPHEIPEGWKIFSNHMTITMGPLKDKTDIGKEVRLTVTEVGLSDMAMAVKVEGYPSKNAIPHITIAVNPNGGKQVMSNDITKWQPVKHFGINGVVTEIKNI